MTKHFTEDEAMAAVARLTRARLVSFIETEVVRPVHTERGPAFRRVDLARMELMCELCEIFDLDGDTLGLVMSLIDQLHDARRELRLVLDACERGPDELRRQIGEALLKAGRN